MGRSRKPLLTSQVASKVFSLFQISLENYFKTKFYLGIHLRMQPSEIENMDYYEYWYYVQNLQEYIKAKNKAETDQQEKQEKQSQSMRAAAAPKMPKISVPSMKAPSMKMPKI